MSRIAILTDSASQIKQGQIEHVYVAPLIVTVEEETYLDGVDIDEETLFQRIKNEGVMPKTSQPSTGMLVEILEEIKKEYDLVIALPISTGLSSTLQGMILAAQMVEIELLPIDTMSACQNESYLVETAARLVHEGYDALAIKQHLATQIEDAETLIIPSDLDYLKRGGRLSAGSAMIASILNIKPVLRLDPEFEGKLATYAKVRTIKKACLEMLGIFSKRGVQASTHLVTVGHVLNEEIADFIIQNIREQFGDIEMRVVPLPVAVGCHTGVGCVGIQCIRK